MVEARVRTIALSIDPVADIVFTRFLVSTVAVSVIFSEDITSSLSDDLVIYLYAVIPMKIRTIKICYLFIICVRNQMNAGTYEACRFWDHQKTHRLFPLQLSFRRP